VTHRSWDLGHDAATANALERISVTSLFVVLGLVTAVAAAARSTWSPCGLSMVSTITPVGERGRGNRYRNTAAWFVVGATVGGAMLGGAAAVLAWAVAAVHVSGGAAGSIAAAGSVLAAAGDAGLGVHFPLFRRQVNERWLDQFRGWFYGVGFGWQIGVGFATYIMTAAVFLTVLLAALTASPVAALALGTTFGVTRGLAVLLTSRLVTPAELRAFHRRFDALGAPVRSAVIGVELAVAVIASLVAWPPAGALVAACLLTAGLIAAVTRRHTSRLPDAT
jgi:hypothetical protein